MDLTEIRNIVTTDDYSVDGKPAPQAFVDDHPHHLTSRQAVIRKHEIIGPALYERASQSS
jgi:hypothetical protein